ncbi:MAG: outer membrane lipoprotein carrier protein LolA [Cyclobacteriaceae bacterium]|nr:outer membrane lipoprotein carrier protein LolA [Cyclobacteriaceae bacterium]
MKKLGLVIVLLGFFVGVTAQEDQKAKVILDKMSDKYQSIPSYKTNFIYRLHNKVEDIDEEFSGEIMVKGEKYVLLMSDQEIFNNGETIWTFLMDANEVNVDYYMPNEGDLSPNNIYSAYKKGYRYRWIEIKKVGSRTLDVVELQPEDPKDPDKIFFRIILNIDQDDNTIHSWEMYDRGGNVFSYTISGFNPKFIADDAFFEFNESEYPDVEVVDLR